MAYKLMIEEEHKAEESITYTGDKSKVGVPWRESKPRVPGNRHAALSRLCKTENKLKKDTVVETEYAQTIKV